MEFDSEFNRELSRYIFVLVTMPVWVPFLKALWGELKRAMRPEGGIFGPKPSARQRAVIEREIAMEPDPLIHAPIAHRGWGARRRAAPARKPAGGGRAAKTMPTRNVGATRERRRGFR